MSVTVKAGWLKDKQGNKLAPKTYFSQVQADDGTPLDEALQNAAVKYNLSKDGNTIVLTGSDESVSSIEESVTTATDDNAGNVVLESMSGISYLDDAIKQELINATIAALKTETLTFTLTDGTTVTKEVVVK